MESRDFFPVTKCMLTVDVSAICMVIVTLCVPQVP